MDGRTEGGVLIMIIRRVGVSSGSWNYVLTGLSRGDVRGAKYGMWVT